MVRMNRLVRLARWRRDADKAERALNKVLLILIRKTKPDFKLLKTPVKKLALTKLSAALFITTCLLHAQSAPTLNITRKGDTLEIVYAAEPHVAYVFLRQPAGKTNWFGKTKEAYEHGPWITNTVPTTGTMCLFRVVAVQVVGE